MKLQIRFILCAIIAMALALTAAAQQPETAPKNLLGGKTEIVKTGEDASGNNVWGLKNPPPPRKTTPTPAPPYINSFNSEADNIAVGDAVTLSWSVSDAKTVTINGQDVTSDAQLVVTPTTTTAYRLVATNAGGRVAEDLVIRVKPTSVPPSTDWNRLLSDWWWLLILLALIIGGAWAFSRWLAERRLREDQAAWREDRLAEREIERNRLQQTQPPTTPPASSVVNHFTVYVNGQPLQGATVTDNQTAAPGADPMNGLEPAARPTEADAGNDEVRQPETAAAAQSETK